MILEMPKIIENADEATVGAWNVAEGAAVKKGDILVELITDKTTMELEAPKDGVVLKIYAPSQSVVPVGYALCAIGEAGETAPDMTAVNDAVLAAFRKNVTGGVDVSLLASARSAVAEKPAYKVAPAARAFARQSGVSLDDVAAFCGRDMIHRKDVEDFLNSKAPKDVPAPPAMPTAQPPAVAAPLPCGASLVTAPETPRQRVALVTGATGGIGNEIARRLAKAGCKLAIHTCHAAQKAEELCAELRGQGTEADVFQADLAATPQACQQLIDAVIARFGRIDILVNNAGMIQDGPVSFMPDDAWNAVEELCLNVPFRLIRACSMPMARNRWGRIVNISSEAGRMGAANRANYASAKEGLCGLTRSVAQELATMGIRVNAVSPGFIDTALTAQMPEKRKQEIMKNIPVRRFGHPGEVAALVAFLASEDADYITGQVISINGGLA